MVNPTSDDSLVTYDLDLRPLTLRVKADGVVSPGHSLMIITIMHAKIKVILPPPTKKCCKGTVQRVAFCS